MTTLTTHQKGECGALLVQYALLKYGIDSAPMTTDRGIDLVALAPDGSRTATIQVKTTSYNPNPSNPLDEGVVWALAEDCPAQYVALVDLERDMFWLLPIDVFKRESTRAGEGMRRLGWYVKRERPRATSKHEADFSEFEMKVAVPALFKTLRDS